MSVRPAATEALPASSFEYERSWSGPAGSGGGAVPLRSPRLARRNNAGDAGADDEMVHPDPETPDEELVALILEDSDAAASQRAYRILLDRYWKTVVILLRARVGTSCDVEDIAQEAFVRAWRALPRLENPKLFLGWLLRIARNLATDHLRRHPREASLEALQATDAVEAAWRSSPPQDPQESLEHQEEVERVMRALHALAEPYQTVIALRYLSDMSNRELADRLGEPEGTIRNRIFRALQKLRDLLQPTRVTKP